MVFLLFMVLLLLSLSLIIVIVVMVLSPPESSTASNEAAKTNKAAEAYMKLEELSEGTTMVSEDKETLGEVDVNGKPPQSQSIFMRLPSELRCSIYKALLKVNNDIRDPVSKSKKTIQANPQSCTLPSSPRVKTSTKRLIRSCPRQIASASRMMSSSTDFGRHSVPSPSNSVTAINF